MNRTDAIHINKHKAQLARFEQERFLISTYGPNIGAKAEMSRLVDHIEAIPTWKVYRIRLWCHLVYRKGLIKYPRVVKLVNLVLGIK